MKCNPFSAIAILFFFGTMILSLACLAQTAPQVQSSPPDQHPAPANQRPTPGTSKHSACGCHNQQKR